MYIADLLSRNYIQRVENTEENLNDVVHAINEVEIQFKNDRIEKFREETNMDEHLSKILKYLDTGWPNKMIECGEIKHYFKIKN